MDKARQRRRNRKRKRRNISSSSSSSSSSSPSEDERPRAITPQQLPAEDPLDSETDSSDSSSATSTRAPDYAKDVLPGPSEAKQPPSRSPSPPITAISPLVSLNPATDSEKQKEKEMKERFRKFWMASVADEFKDDLEEIRKQESDLSTSRLSLLIDALASGADAFSAMPQAQGHQVNEMEIVLDPS